MRCVCDAVDVAALLNAVGKGGNLVKFVTNVPLDCFVVALSIAFV